MFLELFCYGSCSYLFNFFCFNLIVAYCFKIIAVQCKLISGPETVLVVVGDTIQLPCNSDLSDAVQWTWKRPGATEVLDIYRGGVIVDSFIKRFSVHREPNGFQNLTIRNVSYEDAGEYTCIDDMGFGRQAGQFASAQLSVLGQYQFLS